MYATPAAKRDSLTTGQRIAYRAGRRTSQRNAGIPASWDMPGGMTECDYAHAGYMDHACDRTMWSLCNDEGRSAVAAEHVCKHCADDELGSDWAANHDRPVTAAHVAYCATHGHVTPSSARCLRCDESVGAWEAVGSPQSDDERQTHSELPIAYDWRSGEVREYDGHDPLTGEPFYLYRIDGSDSSVAVRSVTLAGMWQDSATFTFNLPTVESRVFGLLGGDNPWQTESERERLWQLATAVAVDYDWGGADALAYELGFTLTLNR